MLIVERCEYPIRQNREWLWLQCPDGLRIGRHKDDDVAIGRLAGRFGPLGPIGTVLACKEALRGDGFPGTQKRKGIARYAIDGEMVLVNGQDHLWYAKRPTITAKRMPLDWARLFFRTTAIDLRRVDSMTAREANLWGVFAELDRDGTDAGRLIAVVTEQDATKERYLADNPGATWGDWAWFITAERVAD